jgi:hypothetical protein
MNACCTLGEPSIKVLQNKPGVSFSKTTLKSCGFKRQMWLSATAELVLIASKKVAVCESIAIVLIS